MAKKQLHGAERIPIGQRMMKGGQLYLDECGPIEGGGSIGDGSGSGQSEADGRVKQAETGTGRTRLSDSSLGSDSSYGSNSNSSGSSSTQGRGSHSSQSLEEMADSLASLRPAFHQIPSPGGTTMSHHSNCPMGQKHPSAVGTLPGPSIPAALAGTSIAPVLPRYRRNTGGSGRPLRQQQSMPEPSPSSSSSRHLPHQQSSITSATAAGIADFGGDGTDRHRLAAPSRPRRKISEPPPSSAYPQFVPSQPQQRRKNSIRNVFSKMSTPSIMIGADPADLLALQHLIPPTDERLLNRRQSSQEQINQQQQQQQQEERWMKE